MKRRSKIGAIAAVVFVAGAVGTAIAAAGGDDDATDTPITGSHLDKASTVALDYTGEGQVSGTETGGEESYYEVEITLDDGSQVDVQLDRDFNVVGSENDGQGEESDGE